MPTVVKQEAGKILQTYLKQHGISQTWLARKLGFSKTQVGDRINGRIKFDADFALQVANVLGISANIFLNEIYAKRVK